MNSISPVNFKGAYCIPVSSIQNRTGRRLIDNTEKYNVIIEPGGYRNQDSVYIHSPYEHDIKIVKIFNTLKIPYQSMDISENLSSERVLSRIVLSDFDELSGKKLIKVKTKKLDALLQKNKDTYVGINASNGSSLRYERFKRYLRTNQPINATGIYLRKDKKGEITAGVQDGRHRFAVLRDLGFDKIPVSMDKDSIELAKEAGLF